jgi:hypothetical protein
MRRFLARLGFVHHRLWRRDSTYRAAVLLGPPPLLGGMIAAALWAGVSAISQPHGAASPPPPWGTPSGPRGVAASTAAPRPVKPGMDLPAPGPDGRPAGLATGWQGGIQRVEMNAAVDANILPTRLAPLTFDDTSLDLGRIVAAGPASERFVGVGLASLAVRTPGTYALTLRIERDDADPATCLQRLVFANQRIVSNITLDLAGPKVLNFEPVSFTLQPGLYPIAVAFGCWRDTKEGGVGKAIVLIRHPDQDELRPARPDEILRAVSAKP